MKSDFAPAEQELIDDKREAFLSRSNVIGTYGKLSPVAKTLVDRAIKEQQELQYRIECLESTQAKDVQPSRCVRKGPDTIAPADLWKEAVLDALASVGADAAMTMHPRDVVNLVLEIQGARLLYDQDTSNLPYMFKGTRFKLSFTKKGYAKGMENYHDHLEGRWVALVPAEDDRHLKLPISD